MHGDFQCHCTRGAYNLPMIRAVCQLEHVCAAVCHHQTGERWVFSAWWQQKGIQALDEIGRTSTSKKQFVQNNESLLFIWTIQETGTTDELENCAEKVAGVGWRKLNPVSVVQFSPQALKHGTADCDGTSLFIQSAGVLESTDVAFVTNLQTKVTIYTVHSCNISIILCNSHL